MIDNLNENRYLIFLSIFSGFIAAIYYILQGINYTINLYKNFHLNPLFIAINFLAILAIIFALRKWFKILTETFNKKVRKIDIRKDIDTYSKVNKKIDLVQLLPTNNLLGRWFKELAEEAVIWSDDVHLLTLSFYLNVYKESVKPILQGLYLSEWKQEERYFYIGLNTDTPKESDRKKDKCVTPFFYVYDNWDQVVKKAYNRIKDKLPDEYELLISSTYPVLHFEFQYTLGVVRKEIFEYDSQFLIDKKSGDKFKL